MSLVFIVSLLMFKGFICINKVFFASLLNDKGFKKLCQNQKIYMGLKIYIYIKLDFLLPKKVLR
jgi:hypothetical protein